MDWTHPAHRGIVRDMNETVSCDIAIVGGGHAGLLAALALDDAGFDVRVVDPVGRCAQPSTGRTLALLAGSRMALEALGLWRHIAPVAWPVHRVDVRDTASGGHVVYRSGEVGEGPLAHGVDNGRLRDALAAALPRALWLEGRVCAMPGRGRLLLADGRHVVTGLVIGADGRGSVVRRLARIGLDRWSYRQTALSFIVTHAHDSRHMVLERFRPGGPLATLPLASHRSGITLVEPARTADAVHERLLAGDLSILEEHLADELGAMAVDGAVQRYPLTAQHASRYAAPGLALVGDAAHGVHPIHAQGFNMGVADIVSLVDVLRETRRRGRPPGGEELLRYERERRPENASRLRMTDTLNRVFSSDIAPVREGRRWLLDTLAMTAPVRRRAIRHGMQMGG